MMFRNQILLFLATFFIAVFIFLALPDTGFAQDVCCLLPDDTCVQATETVCTSTDVGGTDLGRGPCGNFPACAASDIGCCDSNPSTNQCDSPITRSECFGLTNHRFFTDGVCEAQAIRCTPGPNIPGCCQLDPSSCNNEGSIVCDGFNNPFTFPINGGTCDESSPIFCVAPPGGCCIFAKNDCEFNSGLSCEMEGGKFTDPGVQCSEVPQCAPLPPTNVPTLSGWGLLSLAVVLGILGIVGFMVIRRRKVTA